MLYEYYAYAYMYYFILCYEILLFSCTLWHAPLHLSKYLVELSSSYTSSYSLDTQTDPVYALLRCAATIRKNSSVEDSSGISSLKSRQNTASFDISNSSRSPSPIQGISDCFTLPPMTSVTHAALSTGHWRRVWLVSFNSMQTWKSMKCKAWNLDTVR